LIKLKGVQRWLKNLPTVNSLLSKKSSKFLEFKTNTWSSSTADSDSNIRKKSTKSHFKQLLLKILPDLSKFIKWNAKIKQTSIEWFFKSIFE